MNIFERTFAEFFATNDPIVVVVKEGRWEATGPETTRSQMLMQALAMIGGISESVPDGTYHFNYKSNWFKGALTLEPVDLIP